MYKFEMHKQWGVSLVITVLGFEFALFLFLGLGQGQTSLTKANALPISHTGAPSLSRSYMTVWCRNTWSFNQVAAERERDRDTERWRCPAKRQQQIFAPQLTAVCYAAKVAIKIIVPPISKH